MSITPDSHELSEGKESRSKASLALLLVPLVLLLISFVLPIATILIRSFNAEGRLGWSEGLTFDHYQALVQDDLLRQISIHTTWLAVWSTALTFLLAFPVAYLIANSARRVAFVLYVLILLPFFVSILIRLFAYTGVLGRNGILNQALGFVGLGPYELLFTSKATVIGMIAYLMPFMTLVLAAAMSTIDRDQLTVAQTFGARPGQAFRQIYLPQLRGGILSALSLCFVLGLGFFLTPAILGGPQDLTLPLYIQRQVSLYSWGGASAAGILLLVISLLGYAVALRAGGAAVLSPSGRPVGKGATATPVLRRGSPSWWLGWLATSVTLVLLLSPLIVIVPAAFSVNPLGSFPPEEYTLEWVRQAVTDPQWTTPLLKSLRVAAASAVLAVSAGLILARVGARLASRGARTSIQVLALAPIVAPVILLAIGTYDVQDRLGLLGSEFGLVLAHAALSLPFTFIILANALSGTDPSLEEAAWVIGVSRAKAFWTVVVPNIWVAIAGALLIAFMTSWDEVVIALFQVGLQKTLPVAIYADVVSGASPVVSGVAVVLVAPVVVGVLAYAGWGSRPRRRSVA